jgi:hypothetical protein
MMPSHRSSPAAAAIGLRTVPTMMIARMATANAGAYGVVMCQAGE